MNAGNYKDDFFEAQSRGEKGGKPRSGDRFGYSGQRFLPYIKMPVEYSVIAAIGVLVLVIVAYAIGVENGKRVRPHEDLNIRKKGIVAAQVTDIAEPRAEKRVKKTAEEERSLSEKDGTAAEEMVSVIVDADTEEKYEDIQEPEAPETVAAPAPVKTEKKVEIGGDKEYIVQLAAFKNRVSAQEAADKLKTEGIGASMERKGDWFQVYAGGYRTIGEAQEAKQGFSESYSDCYIRRVR
ncbi:MAG: SPOR domain-containing protein [Candidatus Omnitrophota bacterium]